MGLSILMRKYINNKYNIEYRGLKFGDLGKNIVFYGKEV